MKTIIEQIYALKILPVITIDSPEKALDLARTLSKSGLKAAEITFRTDAAAEAMKIISSSKLDLLLGAGTILNIEQAKIAIDSGASFLVSPGISRPLIEFALDNNILILPGICTPSELMIAKEYDLQVVKFFPANQYGGLSTIRALAPVFPGIKFLPTGGVNIDNLKEYLSDKNVFAVGGSWMVKEELIREGKFDNIRILSEEAIKIANFARESLF